MPFRNPIVGGNGSLIIEQIKSPNYVADQVGWSIKKDGTADFADISVSNGDPLIPNRFSVSAELQALKWERTHHRRILQTGANILTTAVAQNAVFQGQTDIEIISPIDPDNEPDLVGATVLVDVTLTLDVECNVAGSNVFIASVELFWPEYNGFPAGQELSSERMLLAGITAGLRQTMTTTHSFAAALAPDMGAYPLDPLDHLPFVRIYLVHNAGVSTYDVRPPDGVLTVHPRCFTF